MIDEKPQERQPIYFRLINDLPVMCWSAPDGSEAIVQIGRHRPRVVPRYYSGREDHESLSEVLLGFLAQTKTMVDATAWHAAMGSGRWGDGTAIDWSKE